MKRLFTNWATGFVLLCSPTLHAQSPQSMELLAGIHRIEAEIAATPEARQFGLMRRREMPNQVGMLFVFPLAAVQCMWMRNTFIPLSVAYLDDKGIVINVEDMQPQTETSHCSKKPVRFALEMNQGWFKRRNIGPGSIITGLDRAPEAR